eukprot:jgi/Bigna1/86731/estExt_fgenesh1_pg.C_130091
MEQAKAQLPRGKGNDGASERGTITNSSSGQRKGGSAVAADAGGRTRRRRRKPKHGSKSTPATAASSHDGKKNKVKNNISNSGSNRGATSSRRQRGRRKLYRPKPALAAETEGRRRVKTINQNEQQRIGVNERLRRHQQQQLKHHRHNHHHHPRERKFSSHMDRRDSDDEYDRNPEKWLRKEGDTANTKSVVTGVGVRRGEETLSSTHPISPSRSHCVSGVARLAIGSIIPTTGGGYNVTNNMRRGRKLERAPVSCQQAHSHDHSAHHNNRHQQQQQAYNRHRRDMVSSASRLFDSIKHSHESPPLKGGGGRFQDDNSHRIGVDGGPHHAQPSFKNSTYREVQKDDVRGKTVVGRDSDKDEGRNEDIEDMAEEFSELGFSIDYTDPV